MDGMVAIEGGKKSATGDLFNEVPDRIADVMILAGAGFCVFAQPWGIHLGWLAAALAVMTACIRMQGAALTGKHDFSGPMAKQHRMAFITALCVIWCAFAERDGLVPVGARGQSELATAGLLLWCRPRPTRAPT